jgi:hypothetical protein
MELTTGWWELKSGCEKNYWGGIAMEIWLKGMGPNICKLIRDISLRERIIEHACLMYSGSPNCKRGVYAMFWLLISFGVLFMYRMETTKLIPWCEPQNAKFVSEANIMAGIFIIMPGNTHQILLSVTGV